jgi:hypothetical protein
MRERICGISNRRVNVIRDQMRISFEQILDGCPLGQFSQNQLNGDASAANDWLSQHNSWVDLNSRMPRHWPRPSV